MFMCVCVCVSVSACVCVCVFVCVCDFLLDSKYYMCSNCHNLGAVEM